MILGDLSRQKINRYFLNLHEINLYVQLRTRVQKSFISITRFKFLNGRSEYASRQINPYSIHNNALPYKQITIIQTIHEVQILTQHTTHNIHAQILIYNKYLLFIILSQLFKEGNRKSIYKIKIYLKDPKNTYLLLSTFILIIYYNYF